MTTLRRDRQHVRAAALRLIGARRQLHRQTSRLRERFDRYRPALVVGGGFLAGMLLGRNLFAKATRSAFSIASLGIGLMRSSLGSMLLARILRQGAPTAKAAVASTRTNQG